MTRTVILLLLPSVLVGCSFENLEPYYTGGPAPSITGLDIDAERGTIGGQTVTISGSNFGGDPNAITVVFGNQNAQVVSASESALTVVTPAGPIMGGAVDVAVGTVGGQARLEGVYTYEVPARADEQIAYITIANDTLSCYGGIFIEEIGGCESFAYTGNVGIEGRGEGFEFAFPRSHIPFSLGKGGFAQGHTVSWEEWALLTPPQELNTFDLEDLTSDQRVDLGKVSLINPALEGSDPYCVDMNQFVSYTYNEGESYVSSSGDPALEGRVYDNVSLSAGGTLLEEGDCSDSTDRLVDVDTLEFCMTEEYDVARTLVYEADWLAGVNFFQDSSGDMETALPMTVKIPNADIDTEITLTEYARFENVADTDGVLWFNRGDVANETCAEGEDEGRTTSGGDPVFTWEWTPSAVQHELNGSLKEVTTYVKVNVSYFSLSWLGGEGVPMVATITVPDQYNYDEDRGVSSLTLPAWVLYSFPTGQQEYGYSTSGLGGSLWTGWGDPGFPYYGYVIVTIDRITEYTIAGSPIQSPSGQSIEGDVVLAYSTGDMGFFLWDNPLDSDSTCSDCIDNDGDGWVDELDPECLDDGDGVEDAGYSNSTCNDNTDNDGDDLVDWEDDDCTDGTTGESAECSNRRDDDGDGWIDQDDPGCLEDVFENASDGVYTCNDRIDNDSDGWIDAGDPACTKGDDSEDDGFSGTQCNDNIDNDGHGDADSLDLRCVFQGADGTAEESLAGTCADGLDNDSDGYFDGTDPDCDLSSNEVYTSTAGFPVWEDQLPLTCYNASDDDGDGAIDAADPGCAIAGEPDGYATDEAAADPSTSDCADGLDNDGDGWSDTDDPDCDVGTVELGYGPTQCNDNTDNDGDTLLDANDLGCANGSDDDESDG